MELYGECGRPTVNIQANNSEEEENSDKNENSFNLIKTLNELEKLKETGASHPASMSEYPSSKNIFNDYDESPTQSANFSGKWKS